MTKGLFSIIPHSFRARGCMVTLTILVRALLNFLGLAALLPVLYLILDRRIYTQTNGYQRFTTT